MLSLLLKRLILVDRFFVHMLVFFKLLVGFGQILEELVFLQLAKLVDLCGDGSQRTHLNIGLCSACSRLIDLRRDLLCATVHLSKLMLQCRLPCCRSIHLGFGLPRQRGEISLALCGRCQLCLNLIHFFGQLNKLATSSSRFLLNILGHLLVHLLLHPLQSWSQIPFNVGLNLLHTSFHFYALVSLGVEFGVGSLELNVKLLQLRAFRLRQTRNLLGFHLGCQHRHTIFQTLNINLEAVLLTAHTQQSLARVTSAIFFLLLSCVDSGQFRTSHITGLGGAVQLGTQRLLILH
mmetsp:Transcript_33394/g.80593  ORF Transcript_33394/g.80593 Transcript_33394/m.80593 type:complete len:292 (-) Transcript_33394:2127-3002(-)